MIDRNTISVTSAISAVPIDLELKQSLERSLERPDVLKKYGGIALKGPDNFLRFFGAATKLLIELVDPPPPEKITLEEMLELRDLQAFRKTPSRVSKSIEETVRAEVISEQTTKIIKCLFPLLEKAVDRVNKWDRDKMVEILLRMMAFLLFTKTAHIGTLFDRITEEARVIQSKHFHTTASTIYITFPQGAWGKIQIFHLIDNPDQTIFKILAALQGNECPIFLTADELEEMPFACTKDELRYFENQEAQGVIDNIIARRKGLLPEMQEAWRTIQYCGIDDMLDPEGRDKVFVELDRRGNKTPLGTLGIRFIRFIPQGVVIPTVGLEIGLANGKIILTKINSQGALLGSWANSFPMVAWGVNYASLVLMQSLVLDKEKYDRYEEITADAQEEKVVNSFLIPRSLARNEPKYRYISNQLTSAGNRLIRRIGIRKPPCRHLVEPYKRRLSLGHKTNPAVIPILEERGLDPNIWTWVAGSDGKAFYRGTGSDEDALNRTPRKELPIKASLAMKQISRGLGFNA